MEAGDGIRRDDVITPREAAGRRVDGELLGLVENEAVAIDFNEVIFGAF